MSAEPAFRAVADLIREHARRDPAHPALIDDRQQLSYGELDALMDRVAAALQRDGVSPGEAIAVCGLNAVPYAALYLGALRAGVVVAPLAPSSTPQALAAMVADARARVLFLDATAPAQHLPGPGRRQVPGGNALKVAQESGGLAALQTVADPPEGRDRQRVLRRQHPVERLAAGGAAHFGPLPAKSRHVLIAQQGGQGEQVVGLKLAGIGLQPANVARDLGHD
ncbi:MAG TPA: class I adenylate-forming enzyme family protein, partial [Ottowia sp.]|nr:class I adenylate-forming enzyme family protein [Ottowia sp.]